MDELQKDKIHKSKLEGWQQTARTFERWARGATPPTAELQNGRDKLAAGLVRPQSAQSIVEFMLVSVPLLALIFGIMEFGLVFFKSTTLDFLGREVARTVSICGNTCDISYVMDGSAPGGFRLEEGYTGNGTFYRDYYVLKAIEKVYQTNGFTDIEYVLLQHVGEQADDPRTDSDTGTITKANGPWETNMGRAGPDIYPNYQYHWQLYAFPKPNLPGIKGNQVPVRASNPANIAFTDALPSQIPLLSNNFSGPVALPMKTGVNDKYNGWRSAKCFTNEVSNTCYKNVPYALPDGRPDTSLGNCPTWSGRYTIVPTDRFYVQIVLRHMWITPFMPTINTDLRSRSLQGFADTNYLYLTSRVYSKIEPQLYASPAPVCGG